MSNEVQSALVWATLYQLKTAISYKESTWNPKGDKIDLGSKLVSRVFVEKFNRGLTSNFHMRNKMYVTDEKKTAELMKEREVSIANHAVKKQKESIGQSDMVDALLSIAGKGAQPSVTKTIEEMDLKELKVYCVQNDIEFHHASKEVKLREAIHNANK